MICVALHHFVSDDRAGDEGIGLRGGENAAGKESNLFVPRPSGISSR